MMGRTSDAPGRLIESASQLWYSRSYADVGVNEICTHADVRKGSFYHFFPSKQDLALAVIDDFWRRAKSQVIAPILTSDLPPLDKLLRLIDAQYEFQRSQKEAAGTTYGCPFGNLAVEMSTQDEVLRERLSRLFDEMTDCFESILVEAVEARDIPSADTRPLARAVTAYTEGMILLAKTTNDPELLKELVPGLLRLVGAPSELVAARA